MIPGEDWRRQQEIRAGTVTRSRTKLVPNMALDSSCNRHAVRHQLQLYVLKPVRAGLQSQSWANALADQASEAYCLEVPLFGCLLRRDSIADVAALTGDCGA